MSNPDSLAAAQGAVVTILATIGASGVRELGRITIAGRDTAGWETAALLRELADSIEATDPPLELRVP